MKMSRILAIIAVLLVLVLGMTSCDLFPTGTTTTPSVTTPTTQPEGPGDDPEPDVHVCESECPACGLCLDADCSDAACASKCAGHEEAPETTTPVITVVPEELEINAGDDIDLMFGVTVTDEGDPEVRLIIEDDNDFDADAEGTYVITYLAINKFGNEARATRTIKINKALSALSLEVQQNKLGEEKWQGKIINFKNQEFITLNASATYDKQSGVFYNASSSEITLTVSNSAYAVVAVINANGVVIEGRDGANNKLVNASNPVRGSSTKTLADINKVADDIVIPAGGYAIVIQSGFAGTTVDSDGRGFMNYNVIGTYGNVVRLVWADSQKVLTPYIDQAPVISGHTTTVYAGSSEFVLDTEVLVGVSAIDDNGTFDPSDDVTVEVTVTNNGGFDINTQGKYNVTLSATDGTNTATAVRVVEVTTESIEIKINNNAFTTLKDLVAVDQDLTILGKYLLVLYTPDYKGGLNWTNGYGVALVINKYGEIVRIYDGASAKYFDAANPSGVQNGTCTANGYLKEAFESRQAGEYILVGPNGNGNVGRGFLYSNRTVGAKVTLPGITFAAHECESVCAKCNGCLDEACAEAACATKCSCHACASVCGTCGKCTNTDCADAVCADKCAGHDVPAHECESVCEHCGGCTDAACTETVCATKCAGHEKSKFIVIDGKKFEAVDGKWAYNTEITTGNAASKAMWIFDKDYTGSISTNAYGAALVLDAYGKLIKIYDGANGGYWTEAGKADKAHFTTSTYATVAWSELQDGELLLIFPNDGGSNASRGFALSLRAVNGYAGACGKVATITGIEFESLDKTISIDGKTFTAENGKWAYNTEITTGNAASMAMWIFDKNYTGGFATNSYGAAIVLDAYGTLIKIYDGANGGYWTVAGKADKAHFTTSTYATVAWSELQEGEILIVFPNDGGSNASRGFALSLRAVNGYAGACGKVAALTGFKFKSYDKTISIDGKTFTAENGKWAYNTEITTGNAASKAMWIFDKNYTGGFATNAYGAALVFDATGKLVKIYDGANVGYWTEAGKANTAHFTTSTYATVAWSELQEGEILIVFPNDGGSNASRGFALSLRAVNGYAGACGKVAKITDIFE